jgi:hypothetical protein
MELPLECPVVVVPVHVLEAVLAIANANLGPTTQIVLLTTPSAMRYVIPPPESYVDLRFTQPEPLALPVGLSLGPAELSE